MATKFVWERGMKSYLSREAGLFRQQVQDIVSRKIRCSIENAVRLAEACEVLGYRIHFNDWIWNRESKHAAFSGDPKKTYPQGWKKYMK